ncbi:MAG: ATP phosphoribosyltransferase [Pseudomonadota bacterium]
MTNFTLAIPSKGRLKDQCEAYLGKCGFKLRQKGGDRGYQATLDGLDGARVLLLSASEIARELVEGGVHAGVTGEDLLHETTDRLDSRVHVARRLGFGGADAVVAVPNAWLDVSSMADLEAAAAQFQARHGRRMRVATKYVNLTRRFFAEKAVGDYRIVVSAGATEAAPSSGTAELIVDITSTGSTLRANNLKILDDGVILESQAALSASLAANWDEKHLKVLRNLLENMSAKSAGEAHSVLTFGRAPPEDLVAELNLTVLSDRRQALCPQRTTTQAARALTDAGYGPIVAASADFVFGAEDPGLDVFLRKLQEAS